MYYNFFQQNAMYKTVLDYHKKNLEKLNEKPIDLMWYSAYCSDQERRKEALKKYLSLPWYKRIFKRKP
jgi:dynactin complex subunit